MANFLQNAKLFSGLILSIFSYSDFDIKQIDVNRHIKCTTNQLKKFEDCFKYPFSKDEEFTIKHGECGDYFSFFKHLGVPHYFVAISKKNKSIKKLIDGKKTMVHQKAGEIAGTACGIIRTIKDYSGKPIKAWYICDLKVNKKYQGEHLPTKIAQQVIFKKLLQCPRGFAICMNPLSGDPKAASIFKKHGPLKSLNTQTLNIYTMNSQEAQTNFEYIKNSLIKRGYLKRHNYVGFRSTMGLKNYDIFNTTSGQVRPWNLLHLSLHAKSQNISDNQATYMICAVEGSRLDKDFKKILEAPSSTAQIVSYGMEKVDFNFLTTDQI